jgi:hypothetical protein
MEVPGECFEARSRHQPCRRKIPSFLSVAHIAHRDRISDRSLQIRDAAQLKKLTGPYHKKYKPWKLDPDLGPVYAVAPRVVIGFREEDAVESATRWRFGDEQLNLIPSTQNGFTFSCVQKGKISAQFPRFESEGS